MTYLAQKLIQQGYIGATESTPYSAGSVSQVTTLQGQYNTALVGQMFVRPSTTAIQIALNFDQVRQASLHRNGSWLDFIKTMRQR